MKNLALLLPLKPLANTFHHVAVLLGFFLLAGHTVCAEGSGHSKTNRTPVASQSCGAVALSQLAHVLQSGTKVEENILNTPAPKDGFSLAELQGLAATNGIKLQAVRPPNGAALPVPSIVHWKIGHYGVLVAKRGRSYRVMDERSSGGVWVDSMTMQIYASGVFLAPQESVEREWHPLSQTEAESLRGGIPCYGYVQYGYCYYGDVPDDEDPPQDCCDDNDDQDADCDPPSANDGASDGGDDPPPPPCCCDMGMPKWYVSAYVNLWLVDRPLLYKTSNDKWFPLKLTYNSRGPSHGTNSFGFGPRWECNWIAMVQSSSTNYPKMSNFRAAGGLVPISGNCTGTGNGTACQVYRSAQAVAVSPTGTILTSARGGINHYGFSFLAGLGLTNLYMDQRIDRYGRTVQYGYQVESGVAHLKTVQDTDGRSSTLTYTGDLISTVTDPYGHTAHFYYMNGLLTNITDAAGMPSFFYYDTNGFITNMVTPYGTTAFAYFSNPTNNPRALLVTEANGEHQLYSYVPSSIAPSTYHWNRAQYNAISDDGKANYLNMPPEDYEKGDVRQLLFYGTGDERPVVSDTVALLAPAVDPNLNARPGTLTFSYQGQTNAAYTGTLKKITSITRDGSFLQVGIERNDLGRPVVVTNFYSDGTVATIYTNTFDISGRYLQKQIGPHSELTRGYGYHPVITNLLVSVTNAVGDVARYTHDTSTMKVTSITFPSGLIRTNEYTSGFLTKQTDEGIRTNSFTYLSGNVSGQTDELGLATTRSYDQLNRLTNVAYPDGTSLAYVYSNLDIVAVKDRLGLWTHYTFDQVRQLRAETNANGAVTTYEYCSCGSPSSITRWNGATPLTDTFGYDILGRLTNATFANGYQLNYLYWGPGVGGGLLESVTDSSGLTLALNYVQIGEKFKISSAYLAGMQTPIVANQYDEYGRLLTTLDRNGITVSNSYDLVSRLVTRVTLDQNLMPYATNSYVYTAQGLTNTVDALNHTNWFVRDVAGRLLFQTNANNEILQFTYNPADEILSLVDGKNQTTHWNYDEYARVTNKVDQANAVILRYTYDPDSRLTNRWSAAKGNTKYKYDSVGNLTNVDYPISVDVSFAYDSLNRPTSMIDAIGTTTFTYTDSGQLVTENSPFASGTVTSSYWNRMRTNLTLVQPTGVWTNAFGYDFANRLNGVTSPAGTFTYSYSEPSTRLDYLYLPNGAYINNIYDTMSRLTNSFLYGSLGALDGHVYQYDPENQRTNEVRADSSTVAYSYDNIGQLTIADSSVNTEDRGYTYDAAWNLNYRTNNGVLSTFIVDSKNQLTNAPSPVGTEIYDLNGNLATNHSGGWRYTYDDENRLTQLFRQAVGLHDSDQQTTFVYDGLSRLRKRFEYTWVATNNNNQQSIRLQLNSGGGTSGGYWRLDSETHYLYDGWRVIQERDGSNNPLVSYTRGNDLSLSLEDAGGIGGLLARSSGYSSGDGSWSSHADYYADGNGNVTSLIDGNQNVVASYRYDPFGNIISKSGTLANANVYRFSSKEVHLNSGMYYYGFRFYDPNLQRWINRDPIEEEGGINLFVFCNQNAVKDFDALGLYNTCGHNSLYNSALKDITPSDDLKKIKKSSAEQDNPFKGGLSPKHANEHGMRSGAESKEEARQAGDNLVNKYLNDAIAAERNGQHPEAMNSLGKGMHLITDRLSPAHRGEQKWPNPLNPLNWPADFIVHPLREIFPSSAARRQSDQQLRDYYDKFLQGCE